MIRTNSEYQDALNRLDEDRKVIQMQRDRLKDMHLTSEEMARVLAPALSFHEQLQEEVEAYEQMRRGDLAPIENLAQIGRILIGLRIATNVSQRDLAERLGVSESQVSRDERNDYHGITVERAQRIVAALKGRLHLSAEAPVEDGDLVSA